MDLQEILSGITFLNLATCGLLIWVGLKLPPSRPKNTFMVYAVFYLCWINPLYLIKSPELSVDTATWTSKAIFFFGPIVVASFCHFLYTLSQPQGKLNLFYWILQANTMIILLLVLMGLVEDGVAKTEAGLYPLFGDHHLYYAWSVVILAAYSFAIFTWYYKKCQSEMLKYQLQCIFWASIFTLFPGLFTNTISPMILKNEGIDLPILHTMGGAWPLFLFTGVSYVLVNGKTLFLKRSFAKLLNEKVTNRDENLFSIRETIRWLGMVFDQNPNQSSKVIDFKTPQNENFSITLNKDIVQEEKPVLKQKNEMLEQWANSLLNSMSNLQKENYRLAISLMKAENKINETWIEEEINHLPESLNQLKSTNEKSIKTHEEIIEENLSDNLKTFGQEIISLSKSSRQNLDKIIRFSKSNQAILFEGERGVGKSLFAQAMHYYRQGKKLKTYSCRQQKIEEIFDEVHNQILIQDHPTYDGVLIQHLEQMDHKKLNHLDTFIDSARKSIYLYLTASDGFMDGLNNLNTYEPLNLKNQLRIHINPLRQRPDDLFYQILWYVKQYSEKFHLSLSEINEENLQFMINHPWTGNSTELGDLIQKSLLETGQPFPKSISAPLPTGLIDDSASSEWTPLEDAERKVIKMVFEKNKYNKTKTKDELGITINTLNSKMKKYNITIPNRS